MDPCGADLRACLLGSLGPLGASDQVRLQERSPRAVVDASGWVGGGAAALTGWPQQASPPPHRLVDGLDRLTELLRSTVRVEVDPTVLVSERAAWTGWRRRGAVSVGGASRLLRCADGWVALTLARPADLDAVDALIAGESLACAADDPWDRLAAALPARAGAHWVERATWLAIPCAVLGEVPSPTPHAPAVRAVRHRARPGRTTAGARVLDLSAMWAGPLCAHLLGLGGATVTKVETKDRPDGARLGPPGFYDTLHAGHRAVTAELDGPALRAAMRSADVVIEASRPRALRQAGIDPEAIMASGDGPHVWVSISGYGREHPDRVAFGDDAAVAGGLVSYDGHGRPLFCLDAVADPLTGMTAAVAVACALEAGGAWYLDVSLARVAAAFAGGPPLANWPPVAEIAPPRRRRPAGRAPDHGEHGTLL